MDPRVESIAAEEASILNLSAEEFLDAAERGCQIAFKDNLNHRISHLGGSDYPNESLRMFLITCAIGGALEASADSDLSEDNDS